MRLCRSETESLIFFKQLNMVTHLLRENQINVQQMYIDYLTVNHH